MEHPWYTGIMALEHKEISRRVPLEESATTDEVARAIEGLKTAELLRLEKYARFRIRGLGRKASGRDHGDLMREAMAATLAGNRRWKRQTVDFVTHLVGVMRSISSHWGEQFHPDEALLESEMHRPSYEGREISPIGEAAADAPDMERVVDAKQRLKLIEKRFEEDSAVSLILNGFREGLSSLEIQQNHHLTKQEYEAALRRLRRGVSAMVRTGGFT